MGCYGTQKGKWGSGSAGGQRSHPGSEVTAGAEVTAGVEVMVGSEGLILGSADGFWGALWGAEGEVGLGVSWRSEVTGGSEVMMGSEGLVLGSVEGFLAALWGAEGGTGPWGHLGVRGHIRGQRSQGEQSPSWPPKITILTPMDAILAPKTPHCKSLWVNGRHLGPK